MPLWLGSRNCTEVVSTNSASRFVEVNDEARWSWIIMTAQVCWTLTVLLATATGMRTHARWKRYTRSRGSHKPMPPRIQLKKAVYVLISLTAALQLAWLQDPKSWNGIYSRDDRNLLLRLSRVSILVAWVLIVLFWQESYKLAKDFQRMQGMARWTRVLRKLVLVAGLVLVPLLVVGTLKLLCSNVIVTIYSVLFYVYAIGLSAAAMVYVVKLTRHLTAMDRASSGANTWYAFVLQVRCTITWAMGVMAIQIFCGAWFASHRFDASEYVLHTCLTASSDVALAALALMAVFSPTPKGALAGGGAVTSGSLLPRSWLENWGCCCCANTAHAAHETVERARALSKGLSVRNPVSAGHRPRDGDGGDKGVELHARTDAEEGWVVAKAVVEADLSRSSLTEEDRESLDLRFSNPGAPRESEIDDDGGRSRAQSNERAKQLSSFQKTSTRAVLHGMHKQGSHKHLKVNPAPRKSKGKTAAARARGASDGQRVGMTTDEI
jgi:hypothetical protein